MTYAAMAGLYVRDMARARRTDAQRIQTPPTQLMVRRAGIVKCPVTATEHRRPV
jgi:hypothetical protein